MNRPGTDVSLSATKATYSADASWEEVTSMLSKLGPAPLPSPLPRLTTVLYAAKSAFRWDLHESKARRPFVSLMRLGSDPLWLLDHRSKTYRVLESGPADGEPMAAAADEPTPFGPALRLTLPLLPRGEVRVRVLQTPVLPSLAWWWQLCFPGVVPRSHHRRFPFECELRVPGNDQPLASLKLRSLENTAVPVSFFRPPKGYTLQTGETVSRSVPVPPRKAPQPIMGLARESAIAALLGGASDEQVKLQLRNEVVDRIRTAVNAISTRLDTFTGEGLQLDLGPLLDYLNAPGPMTPAGSAAIADRLLLRALFWHWGSRMKRIFALETLRSALWRVADALKNKDSSAAFIDPEPPTSVEDRDFFRSMRDLIVPRKPDGSVDVDAPNRFLLLLENIRASDLTPAETIDSLTLGPWEELNKELVARAWFNREFRYLSLQPEIGLQGRHGRQRGWGENNYVSEGLADLIDLELDIDSVTIDFARLAVLGPTAPIDDTDPRFQPIDAVEQNPTPGSRKRAGFATTLSLNSLEVSGSLSTIPTTNSPAVVALALLAPHEFLKLWNYVDATIRIDGLTADVLVYFEQERLSPAGPALKVWITNVGAASLDVSGVYLNPDVLLIGLINPILNELLDHFSPALLDRVRQGFFAVIDKLSRALEESAAGLFFNPESPRPPRITQSFEQAVQEALSRGVAVRDNIRLQQLLNLNREDVFERLTRSVNEAQGNLNNASSTLATLWEAHRLAAEAANVGLPPAGFNPRVLSRPITTSMGVALTLQQIMLLQTTYDAWHDQRDVVNALAAEVRDAPGRLDEFRNNWPEGQTGCEVVNEISGYRVGLAICRPGVPATGRALVYPPVGVSQSGDLTLLLSAGAFHDMTGGTVFNYRGDVRDTNGSPAVLWQLPAIDWWQHAPDLGLLDPRPTDLRDGPPQLPPGPSTGDIPDWRGYWSVIDVGGRSAQLVPVHNPAPDEHVAEIRIVVTVMAGVTTFTAVTMERCGPDLTRLAGELEQPRLGDPGRFRPPVGPGGPRPRPDQRTTDIEVGFRRVPNALEPAIVTASALEEARVRFGAGSDSGDLLDIEGALFSRAGFGGVFPGDAHCRVITAWDVKDREVWVNARLELSLPVFLGFGNSGPADDTRLPGANLLGARADLPILTYRFTTDPIATGPFSLETAGPLAGLAQGANRAWLETLMANHALALVRNSTDRHRQRSDNPLRYAYGFSSALITLTPENFQPYVILAMHPTHWSGAVPRELTDRNPPNLRFETFGTNPDALNLAINLFIVESLLDKLGM